MSVAISHALPRAGTAASLLAALLASAALALRTPGWEGAWALAAAGLVGAAASVPQAARAPGATWWTATVIGVAAVALVRFIAPTLPLQPVAVPGLAFAVAAAIAEEALFRRAIFGALARWGAVVAGAVSAAAFALVHVPAYGWGALPLDLAAGALFAWQRSVSGTWTSPAVTHAAANLMILGVSA